jgi:hypothetical protein
MPLRQIEPAIRQAKFLGNSCVRDLPGSVGAALRRKDSDLTAIEGMATAGENRDYHLCLPAIKAAVGALTTAEWNRRVCAMGVSARDCERDAPSSARTRGWALNGRRSRCGWSITGYYSMLESHVAVSSLQMKREHA